MSTQKDNHTNGAEKRIDDEEGEVDTRFKNRIIQNRVRVDDAEEKLFVDAPTNPDLQAPRQQRVSVYGTMVKQYLRTIEPILRSDGVENATEFYEEVEIGSVELVPPDKEGYQFSMAVYSEKDDQDLRRLLNLPRSAEIPEVKHIPFHGLKSIIEAPDVLSHRWVVTVDDTGVEPNHDQIVLQQTKVPDKKLFVDAIRKADSFLQNAGLGIEIAPEGVPSYGFVGGEE